MTQLEVSTDVPDIEAELGLGFYLTTTPGIGGKLRTTPEDFQVVEDPGDIAEAQGRGKYTLATVRARNWETNRLIRHLSRELGVSERRIFFSGTKDKRAVTTQTISIPAPEERVQALDLGDVEILDTRRVDRAPKLGDHTGNGFRITIRDLAVDLETAEERARTIAETVLEAGGFPNLFGPQRFGSVRPITHLVGKALIKHGPLEAVWTYVAAPHRLDPPELAEPRERIWEARDPEEALDLLPHRLDYERTMLKHLAAHPDDGVGALDRLPRNLQRLFVSAYQSLIFNRVLTRRAQLGHPREAMVGDLLHPAGDDGMPQADDLIPVRQANHARCLRATRRGQGFTTGPLPGYQAPLADSRPGELEHEALAEENLEPDDFRIYGVPHLSSSGTRRALWCPIDRLDVEAGEDEHGGHVTLAFFLPKGSYATCLLREFMKADIGAY